jgi:hypothetical protein
MRANRVTDILVSEEKRRGRLRSLQPENRMFSRDIEGKRYDICSDCWSPLAKKLEGKGKQKDPEKSLVKEAEESPILPGDH